MMFGMDDIMDYFQMINWFQGRKMPRVILLGDIIQEGKNLLHSPWIGLGKSWRGRKIWMGSSFLEVSGAEQVRKFFFYHLN